MIIVQSLPLRGSPLSYSNVLSNLTYRRRHNLLSDTNMRIFILALQKILKFRTTWEERHYNYHLNKKLLTLIWHIGRSFCSTISGYTTSRIWRMGNHYNKVGICEKVSRIDSTTKVVHTAFSEYTGSKVTYSCRATERTFLFLHSVVLLSILKNVFVNVGTSKICIRSSPANWKYNILKYSKNSKRIKLCALEACSAEQLLLLWF